MVQENMDKNDYSGFGLSQKQNITINICYFKAAQPIAVIIDGLVKCYTI